MPAEERQRNDASGSGFTIVLTLGGRIGEEFENSGQKSQFLELARNLNHGRA